MNLVHQNNAGLKFLHKGVYAYSMLPPSDDIVWSWHPHSTAPSQLKMDHAGSEMISQHMGLFVKQTRRGWLPDISTFETISEYNIASIVNKNTNIMYAREESSLWSRLICSNFHGWNLTVWHGNAAEGVKLADYHRPWKCPPGPMKCCSLQQIHHYDNNGEYIGQTVEDFYYCVPRFIVKDASDEEEFAIAQPSCFYDRLVNCFSNGVFLCRIPFHVYSSGIKTPVAASYISKIAKDRIQKVHSDSDNYELVFPDHSTADSKIRLLGSLFLINQLYST